MNMFNDDESTVSLADFMIETEGRDFGYLSSLIYLAALEVDIDPVMAFDGFGEYLIRKESIEDRELFDENEHISRYYARYESQLPYPPERILNRLGLVIVDDIGIGKFADFLVRIDYKEGDEPMNKRRFARVKIASEYIMDALGFPDKTTILACDGSGLLDTGILEFLIENPELEAVPEGARAPLVNPVFERVSFNWGID